MVLPMITGTHPMSARTHSGKYLLRENYLWLISMNGKYAGSDLVCRTGSLRAAGARLAGTWAAVALETLTGNAASATCRCNWPTVSALFTRATIDTPYDITGGATKESTGLPKFTANKSTVRLMRL